MKRKMRAQHFFVPITRVNDEERIVEGYAFVNEVVDGEGGIRLKRSAMEAATPDYLRWGAVREMHRAQAAGTATAPGCGVEWDEKGAFIRAKIVDDQAWQKVKEGVYKGFSVGVLPQLLRGKDIEKCLWAENSLVDRPKDPDCPITCFRAEGLDLDAEVECEVEEEPATVERAAAPRSFSELMAVAEPNNLRRLALSLLESVLYTLSRSTLTNREQLARESIQQFADYVAPLVGTGQTSADPDYCCYAAMPELQRIAGSAETPAPIREALQVLIERGAAETVPDTVPLQRFQALETELSTAQMELAEVRRSLTTAEERARTLESQPAPVQNPVRYPAAVEREFLINRDGEQTAEAVHGLTAELTRLQTDLPNEKDEQKRLAGVQRMQVVKMQLASLGVRAAG